MSGGLYSRIKTWGTTDTLVASDLNAEFDNVLAYFMPQYSDDYSATAAQMRLTADPGESGTESLATSLSGELERLRFAINEIKGTTYWYSTASTSLSQLSSAIGTNLLANRISSGRMSSNSSQPMFLVPDGTAATISIKGATTNLVYSVASTQYTISSNVTATSLTLAPSSNNTCLVNDTNLSAQDFSKLVGENGTSIVVDTMGSSISALVGQLAAFKTSTEYFIARVASTTSLDKVMRGYFFNSADALLSRVAISNNDTITLMKLTWVFAKTDGTIALSYTNPRYAATQPSSPATGDYWFDMTNNIWKTYNSTTFVDATATLVGVCLQDTAGTKAARSFDFFKNHTDNSSIELVKDTTTELRSRYAGSQITVYGTVNKFDEDFNRWNVATDFDTGAVAASKIYYLYVKETGAPLISLVAPLDMRADRRGFYHPGETWRCVGYSRTDGSSLFQETESFFKTDNNSEVTTLTAAVANLLPQPYSIRGKERHFLIAATAAMTQVLPPANQFKGEVFTYVKSDSTLANTILLQVYDTSVETINGSTTILLVGRYETVRLLSDGTNWDVISRTFPDTWSTTETMTFTAGTSGAFTKGTHTESMQWRRISAGTAQTRFQYNQTAAGTNGTGNILVTVPAVLATFTVDTSFAGVYTGTDATTAYKNALLSQTFGNTGASNGIAGIVYMYDTTRFCLSNEVGFGSVGIWGSASVGVANTTTNMSGYVEFPITGWL